MDDEPGLLSVVLQTIARFHGNILTIHQSIPINGVATLTLSVDIPVSYTHLDVYKRQTVDSVPAVPAVSVFIEVISSFSYFQKFIFGNCLVIILIGPVFPGGNEFS